MDTLQAENGCDDRGRDSKELKAKNTRLKKMYAKERLKAEILKEAIEKVVTPSDRRQLAQKAVKKYPRWQLDKNTISSDCPTLLLIQLEKKWIGGGYTTVSC